MSARLRVVEEVIRQWWCPRCRAARWTTSTSRVACAICLGPCLDELEQREAELRDLAVGPVRRECGGHFYEKRGDDLVLVGRR